VSNINKRKLILIVICGFLGLVAAYQETQIIRAQQVQYVPVITLKEDVAENTLLTQEVLEFKNYPKGLVNDQFVFKTEDAAGRYITRDAQADTPLFVSDLSTNQTVVVPEGMVRVAFLTNLQDAAAGAIVPGSTVDLGYVSKEGQEAKLLFSGVKIVRITDKSGVELGTGAEKKTNRFAREEILPHTVTVVLTPDESLILKQHEAMGRIFIMGY